MALIDSSIMSGMQLSDPIAAADRGAKFGQGLVQFGQQQDQYKRHQDFLHALDEAVQQAGDFTTPEGQKKIVQALAAKGFGAEANEIAQKLPQPTSGSWKNIPGSGTLFNDRSGETKETGAKLYQKPLNPPDPMQEGKFELAKRRFEESKRMNDARIRAMNKPKSESAPKPPPGEKPLSAEAAKTLSVASTFLDDIDTLKSAFTRDFEGSIAGIKSGTNPRLSILADQLADKIGRLRSGGAINADEEDRFKRAIASIKSGVFGSAKDAIAVLDGLANEARFVAEGMDPGGKVRSRIKGSASAPADSASGWQQIAPGIRVRKKF